MFIDISEAFKQMGRDAHDVFNLHPYQITALLEAVWEAMRTAASQTHPMYDPGLSGELPPSLRQLLLTTLGSGISSNNDPAFQLGGGFAEQLLTTLMTPKPGVPSKTRSDHLAYAYFIENTRIYEIAHKLISELTSGERLGSLSPQGRRWVRTTEELFFGPGMPFSMLSISSSVRPDIRAVRRNAYYRMLGFDLNHGRMDGSPYPYDKPETANRELTSAFEQLLREIWRGYVNSKNSSGPNTTDHAVLADLCSRLRTMLNERRIGGNLSREEFAAVAAMSWFHLTVVTPNAKIIGDLKADAATPDERLRRLGDRVGLAPHSKARSLFALAQPMSRLLIQIESGKFDLPTAVAPLYNPLDPESVTKDTLEIINHWGIATGRDVKAIPVVTGASR